MGYARGKRAVAISDRSGFKVKYSKLKKTWDGLRVEPEEWEEKHPQLTPVRNITDSPALRHPRPDNDQEIVAINLYTGWFQEKQNSFQANEYNKPNEAVGRGIIGYIEVIRTNIVETGVAGTGAIGSITLDNTVTASSVAGTGAIGTEVPTASITEAGVAGTGALGTFTEEASITEAGVAGTGAIGTESITVNAEWGAGAWNSGTWSN